MFIGLAAIMIPFDGYGFALAGLVILGLGCAPVYPAIIHSTPINFGKDNARALIGIQMAFAYSGSALMPPLFGVLAQNVGFNLYPFFLLVFACLMAVTVEMLNKRIERNVSETHQEINHQ